MGVDYTDYVRNTRPVCYVPFQGSVLREVMLNSATLTVTGNPVRANVGPFPGAHSVAFSGDDALSVPTNTAYHPGDTFSVGGWFNRTATGAADAPGPILVLLGTGDLTVYVKNTTGELVLRKSGTADIFTTTPTFLAPSGVKHAIFWKNAGSSAGCYINGVAVAGTFSNQTIVAAATNVQFGLNVGTSGNDFAGRLAHWAIWNRVLTAGEALGLYLAGVNGT